MNFGRIEGALLLLLASTRLREVTDLYFCFKARLFIIRQNINLNFEKKMVQIIAEYVCVHSYDKSYRQGIGQN